MKKIKIEKYLDVLVDIGLFKDFPKVQLAELFALKKCKLKHYAKGQLVHLQHEACLTMDIVLEGQISVQKIDAEGNVFKLVAFDSGEILGANLLFSSRNVYPMTIVSDSKSTVLHIQKELVLELGQINRHFMSNLLTEIADKTLVLTDKIDAISLKTIRQRINDFLIYESRLQKSQTIALNMSKKELAERLGIQRTSLSRELNKMRQDGLIEFDTRIIWILENVK